VDKHAEACDIRIWHRPVWPQLAGPGRILASRHHILLTFFASRCRLLPGPRAGAPPSGEARSTSSKSTNRQRLGADRRRRVADRRIDSSERRIDDGGRRIDDRGWGGGRAPDPAAGVPTYATVFRVGLVSSLSTRPPDLPSETDCRRAPIRLRRRLATPFLLCSPIAVATSPASLLPLSLAGTNCLWRDGRCFWWACSFACSPASLYS
jgi:hypothetical protein